MLLVSRSVQTSRKAIWSIAATAKLVRISIWGTTPKLIRSAIQEQGCTSNATPRETSWFGALEKGGLQKSFLQSAFITLITWFLGPPRGGAEYG